VKLRDYARQQGISYRTAWRWWKAGKLSGHQMDMGAILIETEPPGASRVSRRAAMYAGVSSAENKSNLESQAERLAAYCVARGYQAAKVVKEVGSGVNEARAKLLALLEDQFVDIIVVGTRTA
jgi:putative resolvase